MGFRGEDDQQAPIGERVEGNAAMAALATGRLELRMRRCWVAEVSETPAAAAMSQTQSAH